jgi:hypothetical protein
MCIRPSKTVSIQDLKSQLHRELTANPKKAAILGLLLIVALYFWAPLVMGFFPKNKPAGGKAKALQVVAKVAARPSPNESQSTTTNASEEHRWQKIQEWIMADPRMQSAVIVDERRNPFLNPTPEKTNVEDKKQQKLDPEQLIMLTPDRLGMRLNSTIIGSRRRLAVINDRPYLLGEWVPAKTRGLANQENDQLAGATGQPDIRFQLKIVASRKVTLEREGKRYELKLPDQAPVDHSISRASVISFGDSQRREQ